MTCSGTWYQAIILARNISKLSNTTRCFAAPGILDNFELISCSIIAKYHYRSCYYRLITYTNLVF